jgi:hypothetical protein
MFFAVSLFANRIVSQITRMTKIAEPIAPIVAKMGSAFMFSPVTDESTGG